MKKIDVPRLGEILLQKNFITETQLSEAINAQKTNSLKLGAIPFENKIVSLILAQ